MLSFKTFLTADRFDLPYEVLIEGGNVWKGDLATQRINREDVMPTVKWLERVVGFPLVDGMVGSTGQKPTSGDIDIVVDENKVNKKQFTAALKAWAAKNDPNAQVKLSGLNVHFRTPIKGNPSNGYVQTDFMFFGDTQFARWSMSHNVQSQYRGNARAIVLASIAKFLGLSWSYKNGLMTRTTKTPLRGGKDPEYIAQVLLGPNAKPDDLMSVERILATLENDPDKDAKLADARETLGIEGVKL